MSASRSLVAFLLQLAATALYLAGLAGRLTPSTGAPSVRDVFFFAGVPVAAMAISFLFARNPAVRFLIICEVLIVAIFSTLLVWALAGSA